MSNFSRKIKRTPISIERSKQVKLLKKLMYIATEKEKNKINFDTIVSVWCDNGKTKPKCGYCPNCLEFKNGQIIHQITVQPELNPENSLVHNISLPTL